MGLDKACHPGRLFGGGLSILTGPDEPFCVITRGHVVLSLSPPLNIWGMPPSVVSGSLTYFNACL